jgi:hypothetical protein
MVLSKPQQHPQALKKQGRKIWSFDIGEKRLGLAIVEQLMAELRIKIQHLDNIHLYPKHLPTVEEVKQRFYKRGRIMSDEEIQSKMPGWIEELKILEAQRTEKMELRASRKASIKQRMTRIDKSLESGKLIKHKPEYSSLEDELTKLKIQLDDIEAMQVVPEDIMCDSPDPNMREAYFFINKLFGLADAQEFRLQHAVDARNAENDYHYAVPDEIEDKINAIFATLNVYGAFWEEMYGRPDVILLEIQASVFGANNITAEAVIGSVLKCTPWRQCAATVEDAPVIINISAAKKLKLYPFDELDVSKLIAANKFDPSRWMIGGPLKTLVCERKPFAKPAVRHALLPHWFENKKGEEEEEEDEDTKADKKNKKKRKTVKHNDNDYNSDSENDNAMDLDEDDLQILAKAAPPVTAAAIAPAKKKKASKGAGGKAAYFAFKHNQFARKAAGKKTASEQRIENKIEMTRRIKIIFGDARFRDNFEGLAWIYRFQYYWTEEAMRDPADALAQVIYYLVDYWSPPPPPPKKRNKAKVAKQTAAAAAANVTPSPVKSANLLNFMKKTTTTITASTKPTSATSKVTNSIPTSPMSVITKTTITSQPSTSKTAKHLPTTTFFPSAKKVLNDNHVICIDD